MMIQNGLKWRINNVMASPKVDPEYIRLLGRCANEDEQLAILRAMSEKKPFAVFLAEQPTRMKDPRIKAIATHWNGYAFRSRLEARWAVFFQAAGMPYEYEKEGFELGRAGRYLPDFYLPMTETWIEVKPTDPNEHERECARILACDRDDYVDIVVGVPDVSYALERAGGQVLHCFPGSTPPGRQEWFSLQHMFFWWIESVQAEKPWRDRALHYAAQQARSARFEHGEAPIIYDAWQRADYEYHGAQWEHARDLVHEGGLA
jgi:hypothetical protein